MRLTEEQLTTLIAIVVLIVLLYLVFLILRTIFRIIKWLFRSIRYLFTGKRYYVDPLHSNDWLTRAQARQEIRFQNSLPPLLSQAKPPKKQAKAKRFKEKLWYPTGWYFDEKTGLWTAPDYINKEANTRWTWDEEKKIWIDKTK